MMSADDVLTEPVARRIEIFTGTGRRRRWRAEDKARIVAESYEVSVGDVAARYGLAKTQLFTWRREARLSAPAAEPPPHFAPVVIEPRPATAEKPATKRVRRRHRRGEGGIELEIDGVTVRVEHGADTKAVTAVIRALKAAS